VTRLVLLVLSCALLCVACTGRTTAAPSTAPTTQVTVTETLPVPSSSPPTSRPPSPSSAPSSYVPPPAVTVTPLPPGHALPAGEVDGSCPYVSTKDAADLEGNRIYRSTILKSLAPVGCRFYFWCCDYEATADILPQTFATPVMAYNAMVATGRAGLTATGVKDLVPGVDAVLYQTKFYSGDGGKDWACTFAKGKVMVTVHTHQNNISFNAKHLAATIAAKF
jgi:hypothetical protein